MQPSFSANYIGNTSYDGEQTYSLLKRIFYHEGGIENHMHIRLSALPSVGPPTLTLLITLTSWTR